MRTIVFIIAAILIIVGIVGLIDHVSIWLNIFYLISGTAALVAGFTTRLVVRLYFQIFGVMYAILAILGFILDHPHNVWFHVVIAVMCLILGYGAKD